uniref:Plasma membrane-associated cation-binding protein 1 n=1 Tax=Lotus japonicus TaxID=34305 RepID=I3S2Z8_LOTJA|nr:unknown [Lotus japonicus]
MGYWKSKVLPKIKKVFEKNGAKKTAAAEAIKSFDESKEEYNKVFEEKKVELQTKVIEIYEASPAEIKSLVKEQKEAGLKKNPTEVHKFLEELAKIEFPGSKVVSEASSKFGPALVPGPVLFVFEKVSTFIVTEEKVEAPPAETKTEEEASTTKDREIVVEEEKKEEEKPQVAEETTEKVESEPPKEEEKPAEPVVAEAPPAAKEEEKPVEPVAEVEKTEPPKP